MSTAKGRTEWQWSLRRWTTATIVLTSLIALLALVTGTATLVSLSQARSKVINELDPASRASDGLANALINEETGVRGYALSGQETFLEPYTTGLADEQAQVKALRTSLGKHFSTATGDLDAVSAAAGRWKSQYALPTIAAVRAGQNVSDTAHIEQGKALFDDLRLQLRRLSVQLDMLRRQAVQDLQHAVRNLLWVAGSLGAALVIGVAALAIGLQRGVKRPVTLLTDQIRVVAAGDFEQGVQTSGPLELVNLGSDVDSMRRRILAELSASRQAHATLDEQARDLQRSNMELEQFAYVASHDLQEPLRKVTSFCQLLEDRYHEQLDDRGRQYIQFAVDGASRMQTLINDLLTFSRVGRLRAEHRVVDLNQLATDATANLGRIIEDTHATVTIDQLPPVIGDASLLTAVIQNLINNAIKFRSADAPPEVRLSVRPEADAWLFSCTDNGIGIEPEYAERIFVIFQRLHPKDRYPGTGIGLAMCRKIIEYHDGRIWLEPHTDGTAGSTFQFTLPRLEEPDVDDADVAERESTFA